MGSDLTERVLTELTGCELNAREAPLLHEEPRHLVLGEVKTDRHRIETLRLGKQPLEAPDIGLRNRNHLGEALDQRIQFLFGFSRCDFK